MKSAVPLYEFMPYGAPELLESRQRDMSRALTLTSATALVLYALLGVLGALVPRQPVVIPMRPIDILPDLARHERIEVKQPVPITTPRPRKQEIGVPVPTPEVTDVPIEPPVTGPSDVTGKDVTGPVGPVEVGPATPVGDALPPRGTWVYVEQEPVPIKQVKPEYPQMARDAGVEGPVTVHVLIGKNGRVLDAVLAEKVQVPMLNEAALEAARWWVFTPGYANGHPVACWTAIPFRFRLH